MFARLFDRPTLRLREMMTRGVLVPFVCGAVRPVRRLLNGMEHVGRSVGRSDDGLAVANLCGLQRQRPRPPWNGRHDGRRGGGE